MHELFFQHWKTVTFSRPTRLLNKALKIPGGKPKKFCFENRTTLRPPIRLYVCVLAQNMAATIKVYYRAARSRVRGAFLHPSFNASTIGDGKRGAKHGLAHKTGTEIERGGKTSIKGVCVCVCVYVRLSVVSVCDGEEGGEGASGKTLCPQKKVLCQQTKVQFFLTGQE